jgi:hypothetical protein
MEKVRKNARRPDLRRGVGSMQITSQGSPITPICALTSTGSAEMSIPEIPVRSLSQ